ncbi:MAG: hypothetical protein LBR60_08865 [Fibrobacter sp.]|jgi:hypothetical protein|nr:hypothetical protein [Fibrobacter sp.]
MLGIVQKKGNPDYLSGRLIIYAKILSENLNEENSPFAGMVKNGLLVIESEFQSGDFLKKLIQRNLGGSGDFSELIEHLREMGADLPDNVDPESMRERLEEISHMEVVPVPAKVIFSNSEQDILKEEADIYFIGEFQGLNHAHMSITSLSILYQARYREQVNAEERKYINDVLAQIEDGGITDVAHLQESGAFLTEKGTLDTFVGNLQELLTAQVVPFLLYETEDEESYEKRIKRFYEFMKPYPQQDDIHQIDETIRELRADFKNAKARRRLELLVQKVSAIYHEEFEKLADLQKELENLE